MTTVWVVLHQEEFEMSKLIGVFSTPEKARQAVEANEFARVYRVEVDS